MKTYQITPLTPAPVTSSKGSGKRIIADDANLLVVRNKKVEATESVLTLQVSKPRKDSSLHASGYHWGIPSQSKS
jgi:hypothetical protein